MNAEEMLSKIEHNFNDENRFVFKLSDIDGQNCFEKINTLHQLFKLVEKHKMFTWHMDPYGYNHDIKETFPFGINFKYKSVEFFLDFKHPELL